MLKTTSRERGWIALAAVLWLIILVGIIFIPQTRPSAAEAQAAPTNSLTRSLEQTKFGGDAVAAQLLDMSRVYDPNLYAGYTTLCPSESEDVVKMKLSAFGLEEGDVDLDGDVAYMLVAPAAEGTAPLLDAVSLDKVDICTIQMQQPFPLTEPLPFARYQGKWALGIA